MQTTRRDHSLLAIAILAVGTTTIACSRKTTSSEKAEAVASGAAAPSPPPAAGSAAAPSPAPGPSRGAPAPDPLETELLAVTRRWNEALARRDAGALRSVYGAQVRLYQNTVDREAAIKTKAAALAASKDYTQAITAVEFDLRTADRPKAGFDKKWTSKGKQQSVRGSLVFAKEGGQWVVVEESDTKTDERRARAEANKDSCEGLVVGVVMSVPEASQILNGPTDPAEGHNSNGLRIDGGPPESPTFAVAIHENHPDHLLTLAWFEVDPRTGRVTEGLDKTPRKADPALVEKMKAACAK